MDDTSDELVNRMTLLWERADEWGKVKYTSDGNTKQYYGIACYAPHGRRIFRTSISKICRQAHASRVIKLLSSIQKHKM
jgi:hypothetical protein